MLVKELINPASIAVVGGSNNTHKPGGKVIENLLSGNFEGPIYPVNPKEAEIQGLKAYSSSADLPNVDLAILAIPASLCTATVKTLTEQKGTKAFIILSAGFSEESEDGAKIEREVVDIIKAHGGSLIGPNCIGVLTPSYNGVFTTPIPKLDPRGCDFISGSGATAVFIMEAGMPKGLTFSQVFSVGNSAQIGVEEVLEYLDETFDPEHSSKVKLLYIESINKPQKLLKHAKSLIRKGCRIAAVKAGSSSAGSRAASSHTGALASSDGAVDALFRKAGIVRCYGRDELTTVASVFMHPPLPGRRIAVITHAGGPAVMLTDALSNGGLEVPPIEGPAAEELKEHLFPGSSTANPIDFLATGTAEQLGRIIDFCDTRFDMIDAMVVIFGSPGLFEVYDVYQVLHEKMRSCKKPIYPVLPSIINVKNEITDFLAKGNINFPDEVEFGRALSRVNATPPVSPTEPEPPEIDRQAIREVIAVADSGYLPPEAVQQLLDAAGIPRAGEQVAGTVEEAASAAAALGYPVVMKVVGPVHKSDVGGVVVNVKTEEKVRSEFNRLMQIKETTGVLLQPMLNGQELFAGVSSEPGFGHVVLCGLGGIFVEVLKDVQSGLTPLGQQEALSMIRSLKGYRMIEGTRGQEGTDEYLFADILTRLGALVETAPEIAELDLNPLLGSPNYVCAVDARIKVDKESYHG
ncbi:MAG: acetate--CoA ligase family protein [Spirochaetia bacterium]|nr:acetate--CoA ligase family protein [Spirochaetia bacterium]